VHTRREARGLTSIGKQVRDTALKTWSFPDEPIESWIGQGPPSQSYPCSFYLEETQHSQPPSLPLIILSSFQFTYVIHPCASRYVCHAMRSNRWSSNVISDSYSILGSEMTAVDNCITFLAINALNTRQQQDVLRHACCFHCSPLFPPSVADKVVRYV
jgi:hypothetical protein